jgi:hypothetical protein
MFQFVCVVPTSEEKLGEFTAELEAEAEIRRAALTDAEAQAVDDEAEEKEQLEELEQALQAKAEAVSKHRAAIEASAVLAKLPLSSVRDVDSWRRQPRGGNASAKPQDQYLALCESDEQVHLIGGAVLKVLACLGVDTTQHNSVVGAMESLQLTGNELSAVLPELSTVINRELIDVFGIRMQGKPRKRRRQDSRTSARRPRRCCRGC